MPGALCVAIVFTSYLAQRFLASDLERDSVVPESIGLGVAIGVLVNLAWSARLLMTDASVEDIVHAWSIMPLASALGGSLLGALRGHLLRNRR